MGFARRLRGGCRFRLFFVRQGTLEVGSVLFILFDKEGCIMVFIMHDSKRTAINSRRRQEEESDCGQAYGSGIALSGVNCTKEGLADLLLYSAGGRNGDREGQGVIRWKAGPPAAGNSKQTLTSLPTKEEEMANGILSALRPHFIHRLRRPGVEGR